MRNLQRIRTRQTSALWRRAATWLAAWVVIPLATGWLVLKAFASTPTVRFLTGEILTTPQARLLLTWVVGFATFCLVSILFIDRRRGGGRQ